MGYTTDFTGAFKLDRPLTVPDFKELKDFADIRHEGKEYPGYYCQWVPSEDGTAIVWDENEKFYEYVEWLEYLIENFLQPKGYSLNGEVRWSGEEDDDIGKIIVKDNKVEVKEAKVVFDD